VRTKGLAGRSDLAPMSVYVSEQAHSSIDKAAITLGLGQDAVHRIPTDEQFRMRVNALRDAVAADRSSDRLPVATVGTTSTTSIDPVAEIADICERESLWLHVDAAYAGAAAIVPETASVLRGCERADSLVVNPHKWLFTPFDLSAFYCCRMDMVRATFALTPEYLATTETGVTNLMDTGVQLGRRFRALKLWAVLRYFGATGIRSRLTEHMRLARLFAGWVDDSDGFERLAPVPLSVVCFRARPARPARTEPELDTLNARVLDNVNASGDVFLSHTRLEGHFVLRLAVGHIRTTEHHVRRAWELLNNALVEASADASTSGR
jgi:aromatic-L-amino-acid decarboxylase